jgi:hypothetical protein
MKFLLAALLLFMMLTLTESFARSKPMLDWLNSAKGPCGPTASGSPVAASDVESKDGHYRVRLSGQWIDVPDGAVITEPNRAGHTVVWPIAEPTGISIRCFMP